MYMYIYIYTHTYIYIIYLYIIHASTSQTAKVSVPQYAFCQSKRLLFLAVILAVLMPTLGHRLGGAISSMTGRSPGASLGPKPNTYRRDLTRKPYG